MNILFISSGNSINGISPLVLNQGNSLIKQGHHVSFFTIKGKGSVGYVKHIFILRNYLKNKNYDVIHAHYSLSAIVAALAGSKPLIVSLMGSDIKASVFLKYGIRFFNFLFWENVIVKSQDMKIAGGIKNAAVIPNGVDFDSLKPIPKKEALKITKWDPTKRHVLFAANPKRREKNYTLAKKAFDLLDSKNIELQTLIDIPNQDMPAYFNSADIVLLTSLWEGSPNVIKEAMACNCKIVSVDVGDIKEVIGNTKGCQVTSFNSEQIANAITKLLAYEEVPKGRSKVEHLNATTIAKKLTQIYTTARI